MKNTGYDHSLKRKITFSNKWAPGGWKSYILALQTILLSASETPSEHHTALH